LNILVADPTSFKSNTLSSGASPWCPYFCDICLSLSQDSISLFKKTSGPAS